MTGGKANCTKEIGAQFTAWNEYIIGTNKSLKENEEIIQTWRIKEFNSTDQDSELMIKLHKTKNGCELTLSHNNIPEGETQYKQGWIDNYFIPMKKYFAKE